MAIADRVSLWLSGVEREVSGRAVLAAGVDMADVGRRLSYAEVSYLRTRRRWAPTIPWQADAARWRHVIAANVESTAGSIPAYASRVFRVGVPQRSVVQAMPLLLQSDIVASTFVAVDRPPTALRRRPWRWPLRIGTLGIQAEQLAALHRSIKDRHSFPASLLDLHRVEGEPGAVDVLVLTGPIDEAVDKVRSRKGPVANAVLLFDIDHQWKAPSAQVDEIRQLTGAVAVGLCDTTDMAAVLDRVITDMSHGEPFDVGVTNATVRRALLTAEEDGLERAHLPMIARRMARQARVVESAAPDSWWLESQADRLIEVANGQFQSERDEASEIAELTADTEESTANVAMSRERWLQATVARPEASKPDNRIVRGANEVSVFIGERDESAIASPESFPDKELPWDDEDAEAFRLTIGFVPLHPRGPARHTEVELPRIGASEVATFRWNVRSPRGAPPLDTASARIVVMFRNRVLQTAVLTGAIGDTARLEELASLVPSLDSLDDRQPFDVAFVANHDDRGGRDLATLLRASKERMELAPGDKIEGISGQLATMLARTVSMSHPKSGLGAKRPRQLLIDLAGKGRDLYNELETLGPLDSVKRIQILSARSSWYLPLELAYRRYAPEEGAAICQRFRDGFDSCDGSCPAKEDRSVMCPNAFLGLSTVVERIHFRPDLHSKMQAEHLVLVAPRRRRRRLTTELPAVGVSDRVRPVDVKELEKGLGTAMVHPIGWTAWQQAIQASDHDLLVLLPHTEYGSEKSFIEIDATKRERGEIESDIIRRGDEGRPIVVLFGCKTSGASTDPAGFAVRFMQKGAALVFGSLTMLLGRHAAALAQRLTTELRDRTPDRMLVAEVLLEFRRAAVRDGLLAALAVTSYGDADWSV